jgi:quercetin dioxygenase-like cupin family protein
MKNGKVWGTTEPLVVTPMIEVHRIKVKPQMKCSIHQHEHKWNMFYCINGIMEIHVRKNSYDLVDVTTLNPGEYTSVKPGEYHWFETKQWSNVILQKNMILFAFQIQKLMA